MGVLLNSELHPNRAKIVLFLIDNKFIRDDVAHFTLRLLSPLSLPHSFENRRMSSRALRKLQREEEKRRRLEALEKQDENNELEEEEALSNKPLNAFDMLNDDGDESETSIDTKEYEPSNLDESTANLGRTGAKLSQIPKAKKAKAKKSRKKKKKELELIVAQTSNPSKKDDVLELDEIDLALKSLSTEGKQNAKASPSPSINEANAQLYSLLSVESKHLNALNEMKRLFGNVVLESNEEGTAAPRRRGRGPQQIDLGGALVARNSPVSKGQGLRGLALKRNPFIMGKEEWPQATSGGLGMELVEKMEDGTVEYRFIHNNIYQDIQRQFESCVTSMDPHRMISMLQFNREALFVTMRRRRVNNIPAYHVSTLLQVSEIAKQQGDHSVAGDLLERALFTFGRSVHSSFTHALSEGKARLDFRRPENREFWLAAWRYTIDLGQRGTWRTAYEWAKLILSMDPEGDPYCIGRRLDQLALRGGQSEHYIKMAQTRFFSEDLWRDLPNVSISIALAQYRLKQPQACRVTLTKAVASYPWIFSRLFQELNISHIPRSIWGKSPRSEREKFDTESYVFNAKDLWSTPEAIAFLAEVVESTPASSPPLPNEKSITLDEARSAILSGVASLINLIPRTYTTIPTTSSDPLCPPDNLPSYDLNSSQSSSRQHDSELEAAYADLDEPLALDVEDDDADGVEAQARPGLAGLFSRLIPWLGSTNREVARDLFLNNDPEATEEEQASRRRQRSQIMLDALQNIPEQLQQGEQQRTADGYAPTENDVQEDDEEEEPFHSDLIPLYGPDESDRASPSSASNDQTNPPSEPDTEDHLRRHLAGSGITQLRTFADRLPPNSSMEESTEGKRLLDDYAGKLKRLRNRATRDFVLKYALPQGAGREIGEMVRRRLR